MSCIKDCVNFILNENNDELESIIIFLVNLYPAPPRRRPRKSKRIRALKRGPGRCVSGKNLQGIINPIFLVFRYPLNYSMYVIFLKFEQHIQYD